MKNILFIVTALITQIACAGTITLADGSKITSPKIADGQTEFSLAIGDETYQFSGKHSQESLVAKPFHYFQANPLAKELSYKEVIKKNGQCPLATIRRDIITTERNTPIPQLFEIFIKKREHIALVVDEYGSVSGLVSMEDVIETLLGLEIMDESDNVEDLQLLARKNWEQRAKKIGLLDVNADSEDE